jgi:hypothetical protein
MEDLTKYRDPTTATLASGRTVAESIRPGKGGITGAVVRRSDDFGVPLGQKPNEIAPRVIVDPDEAGAGFVVDMTQMSKKAVEQAAERVRMTPDMDSSSRATAIMREFAVPQGQQQPQPPQPQQAVQPQPFPQPNVQPAAQPNPQPVPQPTAMEQYGTAPPPRQESLFAQIDGQPPAATPAYQPGPPTDIVPKFKASFQSRNSPCKQDGFFHQIIRQGPNLILVYDKRAIGYPRTWPQTVDEDVAVQLEGASVIYITQTTGIEFTLEHNDICVLLIKEEHPYQPQS